MLIGWDEILPEFDDGVDSLDWRNEGVGWLYDGNRFDGGVVTKECY